MKVKIDKSRKVFKGNSNNGRINENKYEVLEFVFPEELEDFTKYIEIEATNDEGTLRYVDRIENNEFVINNTLSKYESITAQIICKDLKENVVFKSAMFEFNFEESLNILEDFEEEQKDLLDRIELELQEAKEDIQEINTEIETLQARVETNETDISNLKTDVSAIQEEQTTQNDNIASNTNRIALLEHDSGNKVALSIDSNYVMTLQLLNKANEVLSTGTIDLPIESMVVNASYSNGILTLTLQNGRTLDVDISDIVSGLVSETTFNSAISELQGSINSLTTRMTQAETNIQENTDDIEALTTKHNTEVAELQSQIEELQAENQALADQIPTGSPEISDNITLSDSARYYFKKFEVGGKSEQETFTGKNIVKSLYYRGASTLNFYINEKKVVSSMIISGITNVSVNNMTVYLKFGNVTYTLATFNMVANQKFNVSITLTEEQINAIKEAENVYIQLYRPSASSADLSTCTYDEMMLRDSSTTDTYEKYVGGQPAPNPDYECPIQNVTGNVEVKVENKNLFTGWIIGSRFNSNTGELEISTNFSRSDYIKANLNEEYYFSNIPSTDNSYLLAYDKDKNYVARTGSTKRNSVLVRKAIFNTTGTTGTGDLDSIEYIAIVYSNTNISNNTQLEEGSTATDYEPHEEQTATFPLEEGQVLHEGDTIEDKIVQKRKTLVFDGTENWVIYEAVSNTFTLRITNIVRDIGLCSHFKFITSGLGSNDYACLINASGVFIKDIDYSTLTEFKTWLAQQYANGTPVTIEYELAEPIETEFTEAQRTAKAQIDKLYSYKGTTHITSEADLDVTYRKDLETIIDNLSNAIVAQGGI